MPVKNMSQSIYVKNVLNIISFFFLMSFFLFLWFWMKYDLVIMKFTKL